VVEIVEISETLMDSGLHPNPIFLVQKMRGSPIYIIGRWGVSRFPIYLTFL